MTYRRKKYKSFEYDTEDKENFLKKNYDMYCESPPKKLKKLLKSRKKYLPSEIQSFKMDDAYLVFSANGNCIVPSDVNTDDQSNFFKKKNINYPVGSCKYMSAHSLGNSFDPFVFSNIKRENENKLYKHYINIYDTKKKGINSRNGNSYNKYSDHLIGYDNINLEKEISEEDLKNLEKMLWYRSKPRLEKPYRILADQKNCVRNFSKFSNILRKGL